jgi:hypothetical protein
MRRKDTGPRIVRSEFARYVDKHVANVSFFVGMGSVLDLFGQDVRFTVPIRVRRPDPAAIQGDWISVGGDIRRAIETVRDSDPRLQLVKLNEPSEA